MYWMNGGEKTKGVSMKKKMILSILMSCMLLGGCSAISSINFDIK